MPLVFSYGTLRQDDVQRSTFGRTLVGSRDELVGYEQAVFRIDDAAFVAASGKADHAIVRVTGNPRDRVPGMALEISETELLRGDEYEPAGYSRVLAKLTSGRQAWVYVDARFL